MSLLRPPLNALGLWPRLALASVPALFPWLLGALFGWNFTCFFSERWYCIYYFHPPFMDVLFAVLVLMPFIGTDRFFWPRVVGLIALSIVVHVQIVDFLVGTRGAISVPGIDSLFVNLLPIAVVASWLTVAVTAALAGVGIRRGLWLWSAGAGLLAAAIFLGTDSSGMPGWLQETVGNPWLAWHLGICISLFFGTAARAPQSPDGLASSVRLR